MRHALAVLALAGLASAAAGCGDQAAEKPEPPPSAEQLKVMISGAAAMPAEDFEAIVESATAWRSVFRRSRDHRLTLLLFLALESQWQQEEAKLADQRRPPRQVIVNVLANGDMVVAGERVKDERALRALLARAAKDDPDVEILVRADKATRHRYFAGVARACRDAGIKEMNIGYVLSRPSASSAPAPSAEPAGAEAARPPRVARRKDSPPPPPRRAGRATFGFHSSATPPTGSRSSGPCRAATNR